MTTVNPGVKHRRIVATMTRGLSKEVIMVRRYSYFDTAMPRMLQLAFTICEEGDFIEFASEDYGFQLGILRVRKGGRYEVDMNPMVRDSPSLLKLMSNDTSLATSLVNSFMKR